MDSNVWGVGIIGIVGTLLGTFLGAWLNPYMQEKREIKRLKKKLENTEPLGEESQKDSTLKDISLVSQAQYDNKGKQ